MEFSRLAVMFLLVSLTPVVHAQVKPILIAYPSSTISNKDTIVLWCNMKESTGQVFSWYKNERLLKSGSAHILSVNVNNEGETSEYQCTVRSTNYYSNYVRITVKEKPRLRVNPYSTIYTGDIITLTCVMQDKTGWKFYWYKNSQLDRNETHHTDTLSLRLDNVGEAVYRCRASRRNSDYNYNYDYNYDYTSPSDPVKMTVKEKPRLTVRPSPQSSIYVGDSFTLICGVKDTFGWTFFWYENSQFVHNEVTERFSVKVDDAGERVYQCRASRTTNNNHNYVYTRLSDPVTITAQERLRVVLNVSPHIWLTEGDSVSLSCEVTDSSTDWTFSWYTVVPYRDGVTQIKNTRGYFMNVELLSDSSRGSGGSYTLSPSALHHTRVYVCRGERGEPAIHTKYSNPQPLWITGESPPVSLIINPSRSQHFTGDSLSLICEDQSNSTGWTVRRYTHSERVLDCSLWESVTGSTCNINILSTSYTGVYWCESESGVNINPVNITVHDGNVILESPVHPVPEGHPLTLHCLYRNTNTSNLRADFYKDGSVVQNQTTGEMIIYKVSQSDEGFYHCNHPERGESPQSWISVTRSGSGFSGGTVGLAVGLSLVFLFIALLILMILRYYKMKKGNDNRFTSIFSFVKQQECSQTAGNEDLHSGHTQLQAGNDHIYAAVDQTDTSQTGEDECSEVTYAQVTRNKKANKMNGPGVDFTINDVIYAEIQLTPKKNATQEKSRVCDDTVYSELHHNMK